MKMPRKMKKRVRSGNASIQYLCKAFRLKPDIFPIISEKVN